MMKWTGMAVAIAVMSACATAPVAGADPQDGSQAAEAATAELVAPAYLEKDLGTFADLFAGRWDNDRQVFFAEEAGLDPAMLAPRQHIVVQPVDAGSEAGGDVRRFRAERRVEGEPPAILIHSFVADPATRTLRQTMALEDGTALSGCRIDWTRTGDGFTGAASGGGCDTMFPRPDPRLGALDGRFTLDARSFRVESRRGSEAVVADMRRARPFTCWAAVMRGAEHGDSGEGMSDWDFRRNVRLHDQAGEALIMTDETPSRKVRLRLRNVDWPYGDRRPSLSLYVL